jgi:thymidylate kinase
VHARGGTREIFDALAVQERVAAGYRAALARTDLANVHVIDARASIDEVAAAVLRAVLPA